MLAISLPAATAVGLIWFIPESPKWLLATGKLERAEALVRDIAARDGFLKIS